MKKYSIEDAHNLAKKKNGKCLSKIFLNVKSPLKWECSKGHKWLAPLDRIKISWCKECYNQRRSKTQIHYSILDMNKLAIERGGKGSKCLSKEYLGAHKKLEWFCVKHGSFFMAPNNIRIQKSWCHKCGYEKRTDKLRGNIEELIKIAEDRGGKILSTEYFTTNTKYLWQCKYKHEPWLSIASAIKKGSWCPICSSGKGEEITRQILEKLFDKKFPKFRADWLRNPITNYKMEIDGCNMELKIAFEYQGNQHFTIDGHYIKSKKNLNKRMSMDEIKSDLIKKEGIRLLIINEIKEKNLSQFKKAIAKQLSLNKIDFNNKKLTKLTLEELDIYSNRGEKFFAELKKVVRQNLGKIKSKYVSQTHKMEFLCENGHSFSMSSSDVLLGRWCRECRNIQSGKKRRITIEEVKTESLKNGFEFLSKVYETSKMIYKFRCLECNNIKETSYSNVKYGFGCPKCKKNAPLSLEDFQKYAESRGGECVSKKYVGAREKLLFKCSKGHSWEAQASSILRKRSWCMRCYQLRKTELN